MASVGGACLYKVRTYTAMLMLKHLELNTLIAII